MLRSAVGVPAAGPGLGVVGGLGAGLTATLMRRERHALRVAPVRRTHTRSVYVAAFVAAGTVILSVKRRVLPALVRRRAAEPSLRTDEPARSVTVTRPASDLVARLRTLPLI